MDPNKPLVWLHGEVRTPPFSAAARIEAGALLRQLQRGERLTMPHARPMPSIGARCLELRIVDETIDWRVMVCVDRHAVVVLEVFAKTTPRTPLSVVAVCRDRLRRFAKATREWDE
jgi:phage-related protein